MRSRLRGATLHADGEWLAVCVAGTKEAAMPTFAAGRRLAGGVLAGGVWAALTTLAAAQQNAHSGAQPTFRVADLSNPNLKPWAREVMKRENEKVLAGKIGYTARSSCRPAGVPGFMMFIVEPIFFVQSPKKVLMIHSGNEEVRHVYLDVPHSAKPKPSWYGESVGHYEDDTLVIDTIGMNDKTFVDNYRTPHTEKLHVVERWKMIDDGKMLEVTSVRLISEQIHLVRRR
jgi:hypothetical protein